jgi:tyrosyl-tRNA synthetase
MSLSDAVLPIYLTVASDLAIDEVENYNRELQGATVNPRDIKLKLAYDIVRQFHNADAARAAEQEFIRVFSRRELPSEMQAFHMTGPMPIVDLLVAANFAPSKSRARQLIQQGGVKLDEQKIEETDAVIPARSGVLSVGRRKFVRLTYEITE